MRLQPFLLLILAGATLAGCMGVPEGAADVGDTVFAEIQILDDATGEVLIDSSAANFVIASGQSGYGAAFERKFIGAMPDETTTFTFRSGGFNTETRADRIFGPVPLVDQIERAQFVQAFGEPEDGMEFTPPLSFYDYRVESHDEQFVTYRVLPVDGQENPVPHIGAILVTHLEGDDDMIQELVPDEGATFAIAPPSPFNPQTPLGLDPGSYEVRGADETQLIFGFNPMPDPSLVDRTLRVEAKVNSIQEGVDMDTPFPEAEDGSDVNYGVRQSPVRNG